MKDVFQQVRDVVAAIPQTPREFLVSKLGDDWKSAMIVQYRPRPKVPCFLAVVDSICSDCSEHSTNVAMFTEHEPGVYRMLLPEQMEVPL